ncbi:hypothetical protein BC830DRAFT_1135095 [Chytriomyces sp. MP71]|nr:hypothetical protein BC830DRAFT_1135095 [Chytriomyces sp. MP71]
MSTATPNQPLLSSNQTSNCLDGSQVQTNLTVVQLSVITIMLGLTLEVSLSGMVSNACQVVQQGINKTWKLTCIMSMFNLSGILYMIFFFYNSFLVEENCVILNLANNILSHIFYLSFDTFLLFKTLVISRNYKNIFAVSCILLTHRFCWSIADLLMTYGLWDAPTQTCSSVQNPITLIGYNSGDLLVDCFLHTHLLDSELGYALELAFRACGGASQRKRVAFTNYPVCDGVQHLGRTI